jgi:hypothetical protein
MARLRCLGPLSPSPRSLVKALLPLLLVYRVLEISRIRGNHSSRSGRQAVRQRLRAAERREQPSTKALLVNSVAVLSSRISLCYGGVRFDCRKLTPRMESRMAVKRCLGPILATLLPSIQSCRYVLLPNVGDLCTTSRPVCGLLARAS